MKLLKWAFAAVATTALTLSGAVHAAGLTGDSVKVTLSSPNGIFGGPADPISLTDIKTVGAGAEIAVGDGSNIGGFMLPGESIDAVGYDIKLRIAAGLPNDQGDLIPGYAAGAIYLFEDLDIVGEVIVGASITFESGFANFDSGWLTFLGPHSVSLNIADMIINLNGAQSQSFGDITITLQTRPGDPNPAPEPGALVLALLALGIAGRAAHQRRRAC